MAFVSKEEHAGGVWWDAADNVKLHIPTYRYALPGLPYDEPEAHTDSRHQASSEQVRRYAGKIAGRVVNAHFVGEVTGVALEEELKLKRVTYIPRDADGQHGRRGHIFGRHVVQATGFDGYGGNPQVLNVPVEVHSSQLKQHAESLHGKRVWVVVWALSVSAFPCLLWEGGKDHPVYIFYLFWDG